MSGRAGTSWLCSEPGGVQSGLLPAPPWSLGLVTGDSEDEASLVPFVQMPRPRGVQCEQCSLWTRLLGVSVWTSGSFKVGVTSTEAEGCQAGTGMWLSVHSHPSWFRSELLTVLGQRVPLPTPPTSTINPSARPPPLLPPSQLHVSCLVSHVPSCPPSSLSTPGQPCKVSLSPCPTLP